MCDRFVNATDLVAHIDGLRPNTQYIFVVRVINGRRQSQWSMSITNTTFEAGQLLCMTRSMPEITVQFTEGEPNKALCIIIKLCK